jgi:hypothetical protein
MLSTGTLQGGWLTPATPTSVVGGAGFVPLSAELTCEHEKVGCSSLGLADACTKPLHIACICALTHSPTCAPQPTAVC